jgi:hypothetical protein
MLERFHDLTTKPWWHGDISKKKAESYLAKAKKTGRWLVRYSTFPGDFIVSVVTIKKKQITFQHFIISNIEAPDGTQTRFLLHLIGFGAHFSSSPSASSLNRQAGVVAAAEGLQEGAQPVAAGG